MKVHLTHGRSGSPLRMSRKKREGTPAKFGEKKWFNPQNNLHGWEKDQTPGERRRNASKGRDDLSSARALQSLANVTKDMETKRTASVDAKYFFEKNKK